jgi:hypothetical protein
MSTIANEISAAKRALWQTYFANENGNIFEIFQRNPIIMSKFVYQRLTSNPDHHIRVYFGLSSTNQPKAIAVSSYHTATPDVDLMGYVWNDITSDGNIFELYSNSSISLKDAQTFIAKWAENEDDEFYIKAFLISRSNFHDIFVTLAQDYALLDFGIRKELKIITQACASNGIPLQNPVFGDNARDCPPWCGKESLLNI